MAKKNAVGSRGEVRHGFPYCSGTDQFGRRNQAQSSRLGKGRLQIRRAFRKWA